MQSEAPSTKRILIASPDEWMRDTLNRDLAHPATQNIVVATWKDVVQLLSENPAGIFVDRDTAPRAWQMQQLMEQKPRESPVCFSTVLSGGSPRDYPEGTYFSPRSDAWQRILRLAVDGGEISEEERERLGIHQGAWDPQSSLARAQSILSTGIAKLSGSYTPKSPKAARSSLPPIGRRVSA